MGTEYGAPYSTRGCREILLLAYLPGNTSVAKYSNDEDLKVRRALFQAIPNIELDYSRFEA
jgi:hypothetical protein